MWTCGSALIAVVCEVLEEALALANTGASWDDVRSMVGGLGFAKLRCDAVCACRAEVQRRWGAYVALRQMEARVRCEVSLGSRRPVLLRRSSAA